MDQRSHNGCSLAHATRELPGHAIFKPSQANLGKQPHRLISVGRGITASQVDLHQNVIEHISPIQKHGALKNNAKVRVWARDEFACDFNLAFTGAQQARDDFEQRGFAATGRADNGHKLARFHGKIDAAQRMRLHVCPLKGFADARYSNRHACITVLRGMPCLRGQWKVLRLHGEIPT